MYRFKRSQRVQELLLEEISQLIQHGLKDPRIGFVTVTGIDLSDNLKNAKVFVSVMGSEQEKEDTLEGLNSAKGYIRSVLGKNLSLKFIPELIFKLDDTADRVEKITKIMRDWDHE
ncbi:MAG: 30S ribosome-binding factor RbfA [Nitrospinaceae bacterium]|nr:30S ribosome-binding factor RbfA [Nitrospinaceae bacterium]NIR54613.1 30S ribosome-binding factor RbfA [Nitrospinaceae bacterium]NIS85030.1 30S ribosome-binding factor RbfA [Nitrospinaceae bacterium]NIT81846.1 30S ribosome-binding factor RbfA [Nitrospinaceae bacterium]NIU44111.1 30S ribosome-binding factor RbfA [Nitrospinaceae bacterium]